MSLIILHLKFAKFALKKLEGGRNGAEFVEKLPVEHA